MGSTSIRSGKVSVSCQVQRNADRSRLFSKSYSIESSRARSLAHRVADDIILALTGHQGIASTKIAVIGTRSGKKEIYLCDADGGGLRQLTRDKSIVVGLNWGPEGNSLSYTSFLRGFPDIYRINLRTGKREILARYGGLNTGGAISPNGKELALILSKDGNPELYVKTIRNGKLRRLTQTLNATEASPSWSPNGRQLVYVSDQSGSPQLYRIASGGGRPSRLSRRGSENVAPDWGANGQITCASRSGGRYNIAIIDPSTGSTRYLPNDGADYEDPSWAPDGRHIIAARSVRYQSSLYLLDTISDPPVALLKGGGNWISPAWSPR
ncbi:MAG: PD40 domain-containing protein [Victivallales bacterium]|nr:PD40 domain-containing protein [Victivallales bacterium]